MKILVFTTLYPNNIWPNQNVFVKERMTAFANLNGCEVKVVAPVPYFPPLKISSKWKFSQVAKHEIIEGVEVYHPRYFMIPKIGMALHGLLMFLSVVGLVAKIRRIFDFDLIDAHYIYPDGFAAVLLGKIFRKPVVVSARGTDINLFPKFPLIRRLIRYTLDRSDAIIAVCQALKNAMVELGARPDKITVIPNGVDKRKFYIISKDNARKQLGLLHDKKIILSVGALIPRKGFDLLVKAARILLDGQRKNDFSLIVVGEGSFRSELEELMRSCHLDGAVRLQGSVPHKDLVHWYNAADVFCLASSREGWPNVLVEALACGTPAVATNVWGAPEIITSEEVGFLSERTTPDIAEKISMALNKSWQKEQVVRYANIQTWEQVALSVREVFQLVLEKGR